MPKQACPKTSHKRQSAAQERRRSLHCHSVRPRACEAKDSPGSDEVASLALSEAEVGESGIGLEAFLARGLGKRG
eukprot:CAMPEP_0115356950 /NCGR_PEP_ID=MMETSP0270-20121206/99883_1 /TAXON_ID=71861 /ORGANISM="Scrippsiella trochoidea, Strain CCMP3099" /LENGTH=74 /DNA_ID=CAMNT_0002779365 /DNA_START=1120 /DNA_END=1341 /DNA_ORIENTATION=-